MSAVLAIPHGSPDRKDVPDPLVWRNAHEFVVAMYKFTAGLPKTVTYGLAAQKRHAAVSIPANIAEGFRRQGHGDTARFMNMVDGSIEECRYYLILAQGSRLRRRLWP